MRLFSRSLSFSLSSLIGLHEPSVKYSISSTSSGVSLRISDSNLEWVTFCEFYCQSLLEARNLSNCAYPSIVRSSKGAGLSHTGQVHVGFFSFICRKKTASKHCRWAQVSTRHGTPSLIFTSCIEKTLIRSISVVPQLRVHIKDKNKTLTGQMRDTRRPVVAISLSGSKRSLSWTVYIQMKMFQLSND